MWIIHILNTLMSRVHVLFSISVRAWRHCTPQRAGLQGKLTTLQRVDPPDLESLANHGGPHHDA